MTVNVVCRLDGKDLKFDDTAFIFRILLYIIVI